MSCDLENILVGPLDCRLIQDHSLIVHLELV
jgi:hypothetical protein